MDDTRRDFMKRALVAPGGAWAVAKSVCLSSA